MAAEGIRGVATLVKATALGGLGNLLGGWSPAQGVVLNLHSLLVWPALGLGCAGPMPLSDTSALTGSHPSLSFCRFFLFKCLLTISGLGSAA